jgi:hypothetical protein
MAQGVSRSRCSVRANLEPTPRERILAGGCYCRIDCSDVIPWVELERLPAFLTEHGSGLLLPKNAAQSIWLGKMAMDLALRGHDVINAMHRKGIGWIDFLQGSPGEPPGFETGGGIVHIRTKRDFEHSLDPTKPDGFQTLKALPDVIAKGTLVEWRGSKASIVLKPYRAVISRIDRSQGNPVEYWLLTGFLRN